MQPAIVIFRRALPVAGALVLAIIAGPAIAARTDTPAPGNYLLKDGAILSVANNGGMRMFTAEGARRNMKDGVAMETRDGKIIVMKEDLNWKRLRLYGSLNPKLH